MYVICYLRNCLITRERKREREEDNLNAVNFICHTQKSYTNIYIVRDLFTTQFTVLLTYLWSFHFFINETKVKHLIRFVYYFTRSTQSYLRSSRIYIGTTAQR